MFCHHGERGRQMRSGSVGSVSSVASCSASVAPSGRTGRAYPSGMCSPDEPEGRCITASGGDAKNSFAIVAIYCVLKERVFLVYFSIGQFSFVRAFIPTGYEPGLALGFGSNAAPPEITTLPS